MEPVEEEGPMQLDVGVEEIDYPPPVTVATSPTRRGSGGVNPHNIINHGRLSKAFVLPAIYTYRDPEDGAEYLAYHYQARPDVPGMHLRSIEKVQQYVDPNPNPNPQVLAPDLSDPGILLGDQHLPRGVVEGVSHGRQHFQMFIRAH